MAVSGCGMVLVDEVESEAEPAQLRALRCVAGRERREERCEAEAEPEFSAVVEFEESDVHCVSFR